MRFSCCHALAAGRRARYRIVSILPRLALNGPCVPNRRKCVMSTSADEFIDRRRLRRKLSFWRIVALVLAAATIIVAAGRLFGFGGDVDHIARIRVEGAITENEELIRRIDRAAASDRVKALLLVVDSPGGTTAGGEAIYEAVRRAAEKKPVVAQVGTLAASAGYMIASAADHVVARQSSIVGSIGVLFQYPDFTGLMEKLGIGFETIKSSALKAEPSPFNPTTEEERAMIRRLILDSYDWFVDLVAERRSLSREETLALADGSIFTGRQALERKLVDALGGEETARKWLEEKGIPAGMNVLEWKPVSEGYLSGIGLAGKIAEALGLGLAANDILARMGADRIFLDGLVSVWQPEPLTSGR